MDKAEIIKLFGFDPDEIGNRPRGWWIKKDGKLCIKTRDGAGNPIDGDAFNPKNFVGTEEDDFDSTYRYYYYSPMNKIEKDSNKLKKPLDNAETT